MRIYRVIVRGRFDRLDDEQRDALRLGLDDGAELQAYAFSRAGNLAYDGRLDFFSFRVEVRVPDDASGDPQETARAEAEALAAAHLADRALAWRDLKTTTQDMADIWS